MATLPSSSFPVSPITAPPHPASPLQPPACSSPCTCPPSVPSQPRIACPPDGRAGEGEVRKVWS
ncbi:hypothetical protein E2C01_035549 [Portunus trituberculatus]|uniref:Uncharacterized protein n=1 Tax=Portunus trituberculatus TaxID=210409 RepID=A0A5B7FA20_PORTR|nr:hypothetical protein [Portunus trituberculatus]